MTLMRTAVESWIDYQYGAYRVGTCYEGFLVARVEKTYEASGERAAEGPKVQFTKLAAAA